jgi:S1-C subfamily serine protease
VNWVDAFILVALVIAVFSGFRRGAITQAFGWGGFLVGLIIGAAVAPHIVNAVDPSTPLGRVGVSLGAFLGIAFLIEALVAAVGFKVRRKVTHPGIRNADAAIGALVAAFFSLATAWFLGFQLSHGPSQALARSIKSSKILQWEDSVAPRMPGFLAAIGRFLDKTGFPDVFAQLNPSLAPGVNPPPASLANDPAIMRAANATYKIQSTGCGGLVDGSGFPLDQTTVITAAHVVAGTHNHLVIEPDGTRHAAIVVYFDPNKDISVLRVTGLPSGVLTLDAAIASRGTDGAAIGYPGGGPRTTSPARVRTETSAYGRTIYSGCCVTRDVYVLASHVVPGNSGGPFVDTEGRVRGMVFAASSDNSDEAYALAGDEVSNAYSQSRGRDQAVSTQQCAV